MRNNAKQVLEDSKAGTYIIFDFVGIGEFIDGLS